MEKKTKQNLKLTYSLNFNTAKHVPFNLANKLLLSNGSRPV